jgi:hypothetical protein
MLAITRTPDIPFIHSLVAPGRQLSGVDLANA